MNGEMTPEYVQAINQLNGFLIVVGVIVLVLFLIHIVLIIIFGPPDDNSRMY